ncbi:MAG: efflux RND transporter periplasmic adaptor subunit [Atribacterota bacterium]|nr:efflux RND transporter periplasmic adaptor subunit [Atribacterota bacterium]MDD4895493.1 efflux RND transporter periplasmic adaptor subunit [Atribacterota bacterium]MDD5637854.1 efflux RND transporter periplasmic adaptor subunit [Atribacterota bacterium]
MRITKCRVFYAVIIIFVGLLIIPIANRFYQQRQEIATIPQTQPDRIVPVQVARVQGGDIKSFFTVSGLVEPKEIVRVYAKNIGQVKELLVKEGDTVQKNDILMRLDDEQIRLQVAQAKATLDAIQASLEKVKTGARPQEISQAEAAVRQAKISRDSAEENYLSMQKLFSEGAVSEQQHDQAKNQFEIAEAQYQVANESYKLVMEGASEQDLRSVEAQVRQAQSALEMTQSQLNNTVVKAPISGKVTSINAKIGELVSSTIPLLAIVDTSELYVTTGISEKDVATIQLGQKAEIFIDAFSQNVFSGEITSKGVMVDPASKTMEVKIRLNNPDTEIPPGVFARANIAIREIKDTLIIPDTALTRKKDGIYVFVLKGDIVEQREVVTGISQGNQVEILQGLHKDEEIVISGNITVQSGEKVRVIDREDIKQ